MHLSAEQASAIFGEAARLAWAFLPRMALWGALGLALGIVGVAVLGSRRAYVRRPRAWNALAKLHYLYLPLALVLAGNALGFLSGARASCGDLVQEHLIPLARANAPSVSQWLRTRVDWGDEDQITLAGATGRVLGSIHYQPASGRLAERAEARLVGLMTDSLGRWIVTAGLSALAGFGLGRAGEAVGLSDDTVQFSVKALREADLASADQNAWRLLSMAVRDGLGRLFHALYLKLALLLLVALAVPAAEIAVYFRWYLRRPAVAPPPPA